MKAKELAKILLQHPDAEIKGFRTYTDRAGYTATDFYNFKKGKVIEEFVFLHVDYCSDKEERLINKLGGKFEDDE